METNTPLAVWQRLERAADAARDAAAAVLRVHRLTPAQYELLGILEASRCGCCGEGECRCASSYVCQTDLGRSVGCTKGNVSGLLSRLAADGLISRDENPNDRREKAVRITARGRLAYLAAKPDVESAVSTLVSVLPSESLDTLSALLESLQPGGAR